MEGCISAEIEFAITGADCNLLAVNHLSRPSLYYAPLFRGKKVIYSARFQAPPPLPASS